MSTSRTSSSPSPFQSLADVARRFGEVRAEHGSREDAVDTFLREVNAHDDRNAEHLARIIAGPESPPSLCARLSIHRPDNWAARSSLMESSFETQWCNLDDEKSRLRVNGSASETLKIVVKTTGDTGEPKLTVVTYFDDESLSQYPKSGKMCPAQVFGLLFDGSAQMPIPESLKEQLGTTRFKTARPIVGTIEHSQISDLTAADADALQESFRSCIDDDSAASERWNRWARAAEEVLGDGNDAPVAGTIANIIRETAMSEQPVKTSDLRGSDKVRIAEVVGEIRRETSANPPQQQFSEIIRLENVRLNKLIVDLYLKFTLAPTPDVDVLSSICHSIAQYCQAGACEMFLVHYLERPKSGAVELVSELRLMGAFGAWERAMDSPFVRYRKPVAYCLDGHSGITMEIYQSSDPVLRANRAQYSTRVEQEVGGSQEDAPHQQAWLNHNLATTCRNILGVSLSRPGRDSARHRDGVLKVENRLPHHISAFREAHAGKLFLQQLWSCVAVRPYVRYLARNPELHTTKINDVGWLRRYTDLGAPAPLFDELRHWYGGERDEKKRKKMAEEVATLKNPLGQLLSFVDTAETYLQHIAATLLVALVDEREGETSEYALIRNTPSLFNLVNICNTWTYVRQSSEKLGNQNYKHEVEVWVTRESRRLKTTLATWADLHELTESACGSAGTSPLAGEIRRKIDEAVFEKAARLQRGLKWPDRGMPLDLLLKDKLSSLRIDNAIGSARLDLQKLAKSLSSFVAEASQPPLPIRPLIDSEYQRLRRCINGVLEVGKAKTSLPETGLSLKEAVITNETSLQKDENLTALLCSLAEKVATAAMDAHTFANADKARLLFVSRRVDQLLDNRIIAIAQSQNIFISYDDASVLRLDEFAVECLTRIRTSVVAVNHTLCRILSWWAGYYSSSEVLPQLLSAVADSESLIQEMKACQKSKTDGQKHFHLITLRVNRHADGPKRLEKVDKLISGLRQELDVENDSDWSVRLVFDKSQDDSEETVVRVTLAVNSDSQDGRLWKIANNTGRLQEQLERFLDRLEGNGDAKPLRDTPARIHVDEPRVFESTESVEPEPDTLSDLENLRLQIDSVMQRVFDISVGDDEGSARDYFGELDRDGHLTGLCRAIAKLVHGDSCAVFFLPADAKTFSTMRMRAASGNLKRTLDNWRENNETDKHGKPIGGVSYESVWTEEREQELQAKNRSDLEDTLKREKWRLTNQIWHLGEGRVASSRSEFYRTVALREEGQTGGGDQYAYPPDAENPQKDQWTLKNTFRSFIGIPIFTRGGGTQYVPKMKDNWWTVEDATRTEFHNLYRVVGILKLEGKQPNLELLNNPQWLSRLPEDVKKKLRATAEFAGASIDSTDESLAKWCKPVLTELYQEDTDTSENGIGRYLLSKKSDPRETIVDTKFVDALSDALEARWTPEDIEILVAIAMELGRLLTLYTLRLATENEKQIVVGENDIGLLDIRPGDIEHIGWMASVAERVADKVRHELERLQRELEHEQHYAIALRRHRPVDAIAARPKDFLSLFRKLVRKELLHARAGSLASRQLFDDGRQVELAPGAFVHLPDWTQTSSPELEVEAQLVLDVVRDRHSDYSQIPKKSENAMGADTDAKTPPVPKFRVRRGDVRLGRESLKLHLQKVEPASSGKLPFVVRALAENGYQLVDWAGARVVCSFLSDIDTLIDAIRSEFPRRGIHIDDHGIEQWLNRSQADGYRGIHLNVKVPLKGIIHEELHGKLFDLLKESPEGRKQIDGDTVLFPCEIQIRTRYQDSWAGASKQIQHHRDDIPVEMRDQMNSLSDLLFASDKIMDLVREDIESDDLMYSRLFKDLRARLTPESLSLVAFAAEFSKEYHRDHRRFGGQRHHRHLVATVESLVHAFGVDDARVIALAFLQDLWMFSADEVLKEIEDSKEIDTRTKVHSKMVLELQQAFNSRIDAKCDWTPGLVHEDILERLSKCIEKTPKTPRVERLLRALPAGWPQKLDDHSASAYDVLPKWFRILLSNSLTSRFSCFRERPDSRLLLLQGQVQLLELEAKKESHKEDESSKKRVEEILFTARQLQRFGSILETSILLSRLEELPSDPHPPRAISDLEMIFDLIERIRRWVGDDLRPILGEAERKLRATAQQLRTHLPIHGGK